MRRFSILVPGMAAMQTAAAHSLDGDATFGQEIVHQLTGSHHLPLLILVAIGLAVVLSRLGRQRR